jgi:1A family penicillin-binding protein
MRLSQRLDSLLSDPALKPWSDRLRRLTDRFEPIRRRVRRRHVLIAGALFTALSTVAVADIVIGSPGASEIRMLGNLPVATVVMDRQDRPAFTIFAERRYEVPLERISPTLVQAVLAIEDQRFQRHHGLDLWRIGGSIWVNVTSGGIEQGASTITQQLAKLSFLTPERTVRRKLREAYLALRIEQAYSKDEILEIYLNKVYFGDGFHGVEAAARGYFGRSAADLTVDQAALLAGLIQRPSAYAPRHYPDRAASRRATVLDQMVASGALTRAEADAAEATPIALVDGFEHERTGAYFKQAVTRELVERFGWERVSAGGLRVFTTYDAAAQAAAESAVAEGLNRIEARRTFDHPKRGEVTLSSDADRESPDYLQGALVALDAADGSIRALVGGRSFEESQFDRVSQARRQSGSAFKPFVYATALEQGYSPATLVTNLLAPIPTHEGPWLPDDGHGSSVNAMTLRTALRTSSNRAAAHLLQDVGVRPAVDYARRVGLDAPPVPSLVLGTGDVTLLALTTAYAVFANGGELHVPFLIRRVEDRAGEVLYAHDPRSERVLSTATAYQITEMLADVVNRGTGWTARQAGFRHPAAGKTGTTNDYKDAWFVGYTPELVAGAWVGFDRPRTIVAGGYASELAVPIWGAFMRDATAGSRGRDFARPADVVAVEICESSGLLPGAACRRATRVASDGQRAAGSTVRVEYFKRGAVPTEECPVHETTWYGRVVTADLDASDVASLNRVGGLNSPSAPAARAGEEAPAAAVEPEASTEPRERRGFWGRVFGVFRGGERPEQREQPAPERD